jgi:DegV family protein with EDD domain
MITDAGCDFSQAEATKKGVMMIPFYILQENGMQKTAQPNPQDYINCMTEDLKAGKDILLLTISSKLSGSHNSAVLAVNMVKEDYPQANITIIDSLSGSVGQGLILRELLKMRAAGYHLQKATRRILEIIPTVRVYFTVENLDHLKRGGRISSTSAFVGGILGMRPVLHIEEGRALPLKTIRGKKNTLHFLEKLITDVVQDNIGNYNIAVGHAENITDAHAVYTNLENSLKTTIENPITDVCAAISTHTGAGALALAYCERYDK